MREVLGAVVATGLVLIAVFVPVAFFPGTTGRLYAQFSITIAFAVALSVFNAVTLTPALSALLLDRQSHHKGRFFTLFERIVDGGTRAYVCGAPSAACACAGRSCSLFIGTLGLTWWVYRTVPQAFIPEEDPGYFLIQVQGPAGASLEYTGEIAQRAEGIILKDPDVMALFSVMGFSFSGAASNQGLDVHPPQTLRGSNRRGAFGAGGDRAHQRTALWHSWRDRRRIHAAGDPGAEPIRRVRVPGSGSERRRDHAARPGDAGDYGRRQPVAKTAARACSARSPPTTPSSRSPSIGSARSRSGYRSARSRAHCRSFWARST